MSYPLIPDLNVKSDDDIRKLLNDLASRKEFRAFNVPSAKVSDVNYDGFIIPPKTISSRYGTSSNIFLPGMRLNGAQLFIRNFENPDTDYSRILIKWQTGTGKSIAAISISQEFIRQYRMRAGLGIRTPSVFIISFTARETIQEDMLKYPEFGFISQTEVDELRKLRAISIVMGSDSPEARQLTNLIGTLRRRITDRSRGGYYQFYGYKEFANHLFIITHLGQESGFDIQSLYDRAEGTFGEHLAESVKHGYVVVNEELLNEMKGSILIADEIHNVYNILEKNNYGIAIQYVLDSLGAEAPRAVFMSATPITGSASEVVDLLNLLVPRSALPGGIPLRRVDFFTKVASSVQSAEDEDEITSSFVISQLRENAIERIAHYTVGRVSFLLDSDVNSYPLRIFVGEEIANVPYLRLTPCPMSPFHERTLNIEQGESGIVSGLAANAYTLYDIAFPNPKFQTSSDSQNPKFQTSSNSDSLNRDESFGLYKSGETPSIISAATDEWRLETGINIEKSAEVLSGTYVITGSFLELKNLSFYSTKYAKIVAATLETIYAGPGKIMIYHQRVRMSGVLLLQEALRMNGFIDETSAATNNTICAICGIPRLTHDNLIHLFTPARFIVAHSDVERSTMMRSIAYFNSPSNLYGYQYRVIIGSKIVREGLNFRGVRRQLIASLPTDYPTMIQVFGRVVRKDSHIDLPIDERNVKISVFVSTRADGRPSPELQRYIDKGREYLVIQEVERALHTYAVDGFANYDRIRTALHGDTKASLDALPYKPFINPVEAAAIPMQLSTFLAYGHGEREVALLATICRVLFRKRPVWTYNDLWSAIRSGTIQGVNYNPTMFDEGNFALALESIEQPSGEPPTLIVKTGQFYIIAASQPDGTPKIDIESYIRNVPAFTPIKVRLSDYIRNVRSDQNWKVHLHEFEREYLLPNSKSALELSLIDYSASFHYTLIRLLIVAKNVVTVNDEKIRDMYRRFHIAITVEEATTTDASRIFLGSKSSKLDELVGYTTPNAVNLYDNINSKWYSASHTDFAIGSRQQENDIVIGFTVSPDNIVSTTDEIVSLMGIDARFKIRPPIQKLQIEITNQTGDIRNLARGAVCETRSREELEYYNTRLRNIANRNGIKIHTSIKSDDRAVQKYNPSAINLCKSLSLYLLALEENSRSPVNGMISGIRWLYLFCDKTPSVSALIK